MGAINKVICDACETDLTYTGNCEDFYLALKSLSKLPWYVREGRSSGPVTAMGVLRPVDREYTFCTLRCLDWWRDRERFKSSLRSEWHEKWKNEHGTRSPNGHISSWPCAQKDDLETLEAEVEVAAIAKFGEKLTFPRNDEATK